MHEEKNPSRKWVTEIDTALKREEKWRQMGEKTITRYRAESGDERSRTAKFNILWANTEIMRPALYSATPMPDIRPRFESGILPREALRTVSNVLERTIEYAIDAQDFDAIIAASVLDYLLPGRTVVRVRYKPEFSTETVIDEYGQQSEQEVLTDERVCVENVAWEDFCHGYGRTWGEVEWVAFRHRMTKKDVKKKFPERADEINYVDESRVKQEEKDTVSRAEIWEIWCKSERKIYWLAYGGAVQDELILDTDDDTLELDRFFPVPRPLLAVDTPSSLLPKPEYYMYKDLAEELDEITSRIQRITKAIRARFAYNPDYAGDLAKLFEANDAEGVPVNSSADFINGGLQTSTYHLPINDYVGVLEQLYRRRVDIIQTIFEVTGLSDVLRGATDPRETATAQNIKAQFGSQRLQRKQREVQRYVRDVVRLMAEIIANVYSPETMTKVTGIPVAPELIEFMRNDQMLSYKVDVETDSTAIEDVQRQKDDMAEFLNALNNYFNAIGPAVQQGTVPIDSATDLLKSMVQKYRLGKLAEDAIDRIASNPQPPKQDDSGAQEAQAKAQIEQAKMQQSAQEAQAKLQLDAQKMQTDAELKKAELELKRMELELKSQELALKADEADTSRRLATRDMQIKEITTLGQPGDDMAEIKTLDTVIAEMAQMIAEGQQQMTLQLGQLIAQSNAEQSMRLEALLEQLGRPKEVVYKNGRPAGVRTIQ